MTVPADFKFFCILFKQSLLFSDILCHHNTASHWDGCAIWKAMPKRDPGGTLSKAFTSIYQDKKLISIACFPDQHIQPPCLVFFFS